MAYQGNDTNSYAYFSSEINAPTQFTMGGWVYNPDDPTDADDHRQDVFSFYRSNNTVDCSFRWSSDAGNGVYPRFYMRQSDSTYVSCTASQSIFGGVWYHVICRYNGSHMSLWINGVKDNEVVATAQPADPMYVNLLAAVNGTATPNFVTDSALGEFVLWRYALDDAKIALLGSMGVVPSLVDTGYYIYCPLDTGIYDAVSNKVIATNNMTQIANGFDSLSGLKMHNLYTYNKNRFNRKTRK